MSRRRDDPFRHRALSRVRDAPHRDVGRRDPLRRRAATARRCCCCTAIRRRTRCGTASRRRSRSASPSSAPTCAATAIRRKPASDADARGLLEARDGAGHGRGDARARLSRASGSPATTAAAASRTACALDHPDAVERVAVLDISPTRTMFARHRPGVRDRLLPLVLPDPAVDLPERLIGADPRLLPAQQARAAGARRLGISTRARSPSTSAASRTRRRSTRRARTTAPPRRSTSSTTTADVAAGARSRARCSCSGATRASCTASSTPLADWREVARRRARPGAAVRATTSPRRRRTRRSRRWRRSSPHDVRRTPRRLRRRRRCYNSRPWPSSSVGRAED